MVFLMVDYCFTFLKDKYPEIEKMTKELEFNLYNQNSMSVLSMGGSIAENILIKVCEFENIPIEDTPTQEIRIDILHDKGVLTNRLTKDFHEIRQLRNKVVHRAYEGDMDKAYKVHHIIYNIIEWFYKKYEDSNYEIPAYGAMLYEDKKVIQKLYDEALAGDNTIVPPVLCPNCGFKVNNNSRYCPECGERLVNLDINQDVAKQLEEFPITENLYNDELEKYQLQKEIESKNTRLLDYEIKRDKKINDLKEKHKKESDELHFALYDIGIDLAKNRKLVKKLKNKSNKTVQEEKDFMEALEQVEFLGNEQIIIRKRQKILEDKQPLEMQELIEDLDFERETIDQINYREQEKTLQEIALEKERLRHVQQDLEKNYKPTKFFACPFCGQKNTYDTLYCIKCGRQIKGELKTNPKVYCTQCGALLDTNYDYCIHCGSWMH